MIIKCDNCGDDFNKKPSRITRSKNNFCSKECQGEYKTISSTKETTCGHCGKDIVKFKREIEESKSGKVFCNSSCSASYNGKLFIEDKAKNWQGGFYSYRTRALKEYGLVCNNCGFKEVPEVLQVHHIDRNRDNNILSNLEVLCPTCHNIDHFNNKDGLYSNNFAPLGE